MGNIMKLLTLDEVRIFEIVNHVALSGTICLFGIVTNIINIIIFIRQGLDNSINISFLSMAISDLCSVVTLEWANINLNPFMGEADVPYEPSEITYLTGGWPHGCFTRITACIMVYITFERCLAVTVPLKVKQIITLKRTRIVICSIFLCMILALIPEYLTMYFDEKFVERRNETRIGLVPNMKFSDTFSDISFLFYVIVAVVAFCLVILLTSVLVIKMKRSTTWRQQVAPNQRQSTASTMRETKAMRMVVLISTILTVCYTPSIILLVTAFIVQEFSLTGKYSSIFVVTWSFSLLAEAVNASVNIFLYYRMNSMYRLAFQRMFCTSS